MVAAAVVIVAVSISSSSSSSSNMSSNSSSNTRSSCKLLLIRGEKKKNITVGTVIQNLKLSQGRKYSRKTFLEKFQQQQRTRNSRNACSSCLLLLIRQQKLLLVLQYKNQAITSLQIRTRNFFVEKFQQQNRTRSKAQRWLCNELRPIVYVVAFPFSIRPCR